MARHRAPSARSTSLICRIGGLIAALLVATAACFEAGGEGGGWASPGEPEMGEAYPERVVTPASDPAYEPAAAALAQRRPWRASELLAPALDDPERRTPSVLLLAANIAVAEERWRAVEGYLAGESWLDSLYEGRGRSLLARAALGRRDGARAAREARAALVVARDPRLRGRRLVLLARAHDRLDRRDSARVTYQQAAELLPDIADWLWLRAAAVTTDSAGRAGIYARLRGEAARARAPWSEALTLERLGRAAAAARAYGALGAPVSELRMRAAAARGAPQRAAVRRDLLGFVAANPGTEEARVITEVIDMYWKRLTAAEELIIARSAAQSGPLSRSAAGFARAFEHRRPSDEDRFRYAGVLARMGRRRSAMAQYALIKRPSEMAGRAALARAELTLAMGRRAQTIAALRTVAKTYSKDTAAAAGALMLLAELAVTDRRDSEARATFLSLARQYPTSTHASRARMQAAIIAIAARQLKKATAELDTLLLHYPQSAEAPAARYWSGRAYLRLRDTVRAHDHWQHLAWSEPRSYYGAASARRLGLAPWVPDPAPGDVPRMPEVDAAMARAALLESLGMTVEARLEYEALARAAEGSVDRLLATGQALQAAGLTSRAMVLGRRAVDLGATDARAYRLLYPLVDGDILSEVAAKHREDPALVSAIIHQESSFNARATSSAGARGLMQVMPRVGRAIARAEDIAEWETVRLYQPDVNMHIGVTHLKSLTRHYSTPVRALAAYNAGPGRVARWSRMGGMSDPELFVERIPYPETRHYVKIVLRNWEMYRALYDWGAGAN